MPLILEAHGGGWSTKLRSVVDWIAKTQSTIGRESSSSIALRIAQRISCSFQREKARAMLRRSGDFDDTLNTGGSIAVAEQVDAATQWQ